MVKGAGQLSIRHVLGGLSRCRCGEQSDRKDEHRHSPFASADLPLLRHAVKL